MDKKELEEKIRSVLSKTDEIFFNATVHGSKWRGGDLAPELIAIAESHTQSAIREALMKVSDAAGRVDGEYWRYNECLKMQKQIGEILTTLNKEENE